MPLKIGTAPSMPAQSSAVAIRSKKRVGNCFWTIAIDLTRHAAAPSIPNRRARYSLRDATRKYVDRVDKHPQHIRAADNADDFALVGYGNALQLH